MILTVSVINLVAETSEIVGLSLLAGGIAAGIAIVYRWYVHERIPTGLPILAGLAGVAVYLNTAALGQVIGGQARGLLDLNDAILNTTTFAIAGIAALAGRRLGDRLAVEIGVISGAQTLEADVSRLVQAVGRVISVTIPEADDIADIEGYDPVPQPTKETLGGKTLLFPRRLTIDELRSRFIGRLKDDYGVGHVAVELADDGTVEYLAVGSRAAGIGVTLAPGTAVTAIRADPPFAASSGDMVQVWTDAEEPERVTTAELRASTDDVVTIALDEPDAAALDPTRPYRLVTLPTEPRPEREFASLLRSADETMGVVTVTEGSSLVGNPLGAIDPIVVAIKRGSEAIETIPSRERVLDVGDTVYAIARPELLRRLEASATSVEAQPS